MINTIALWYKSIIAFFSGYTDYPIPYWNYLLRRISGVFLLILSGPIWIPGMIIYTASLMLTLCLFRILYYLSKDYQIKQSSFPKRE